MQSIQAIYALSHAIANFPIIYECGCFGTASLVCILKWRGQLPFSLALIICKYAMNTIMCIMNFINAMHCICARSPTFGASHF